MSTYPRLDARITITYANDVSSKRGVPYVAVGHRGENGYEHNIWFPSEYADFAKSHIGKEVTATFLFYSSRERTTLTAVALSE